MFTAEVRVNTYGLGEKLATAPRRYNALLKTRFQQIGYVVVAAIMRLLSGPLLRARTGNLRRAINALITQDGEHVGLRVGADLRIAPYAAIHQYGGVITPKNAQKLAIPVGAALTGNGVARVSARQFLNNPGSLGFERAFIRPTAIMGVKGGMAEVVFARASRVEIKGTNYLGVAWAETSGRVTTELAKLWNEVLPKNPA